MQQENHKPLTGSVFDEQTEITVVELCELCSVPPETVDALIDEGILEPRHAGNMPRLPYSSVRITSTVVRLQRDLGVNLAGAALALELLEKIDRLRAELRSAGAA